MQRIRNWCVCLCFLGLGTMMDGVMPAARAADPVVFVSSFAAGDQAAIQAYQLDVQKGSLKPLQATKGVEHPFFLALSPDRKFLYSIDAKNFGGKDPEDIAAFAVNGRSGELKLLNKQSAKGTAACYLHVSADGKTVVVANYTSGSVASLPVKDDGSLGASTSFVQHVGSSVNPSRQKEPHAHCIVFSPDSRFALAADLGLDQVLSYQLDAGTSKISASPQPFVRTIPGAGPRHLTFHPNGKAVYVINELANSVTHFSYAPETGFLIERKTISTVPADFTGESYCADLKITPDGRFLYGTNRGHDSLAAYRIGDDGGLTLIEIVPSLGKGPQNLVITPGGELLLCANMPGNNVAIFRIDADSGSLKSVGTPTSQVSPSCIMLLP